jgi:putative membrane protein
VASDTDFQPTRRLHGMSWLFGLSLAIKQMVLPLIAVVFFNTRNSDPGPLGPYIVPIMFAALLIRALWQQWTYRYGFGPHGLVIREGLIFRNVRQIEYARIENIDTERGVLHRLLGVADVRVQTSTGGKPEALISVLDLTAVQEMRAKVFADSNPAEPVVAAPEATLLHLPAGELVRYGLIDNRGMIVVAAFIGLLQQAGLLTFDEGSLETVLHSSSAAGLVALGLMMQIALGAAVVAGAIVAVRMLSVVLALVTFHDFKLTRRNGDLRAHYGLFTRIALTLRTRRIQAVHQTESLLHRWFHRVTLNVELAGDSGGGEQRDANKSRARWLAPVCTVSAAPALIAAALPSIDLHDEPDWQPLAPRARGRIFRRSAVLAMLLLTGPAIWYLHAGAIAVVLSCIPLAWMHAHLYTKHTRWALARDAVLFRSGWLTRRLTIVPRDRVQTLSIDASPFDRRSRMANIYVDTAGGGAMRAGIRIRYLAEDVAERLAGALYRTAGA